MATWPRGIDTTPFITQSRKLLQRCAYTRFPVKEHTMSSQGHGTPFYNVSDSAGYRLIELPPELEKTLVAPGAPVYVTMHLSPFVARPSFAVLDGSLTR